MKQLMKWLRENTTRGEHLVNLAILLGLVAIGVAAYNIPRIATVYVSWPDYICRKVEPVHAGTCEELPERYELVWVDPKFE